MAAGCASRARSAKARGRSSPSRSRRSCRATGRSASRRCVAFLLVSLPMKKDLKHLTHRSFLPVAIAGFFAVALIVGLVFVMHKPAVVPPSAEALAADTAKGLQYERGEGVALDYAQALAWYHK